MKILFILTYYFPYWTGLTKYAVRLAEGLVKRGHQITILTSRHQQDLPKEEIVNKVKIYRLPVCLRFSRSLIMPSFFSNLFKLMRENDIVCIYLPLMEAPLVCLMAKILRKKVVLVHNGDLLLPPGLLNQAIEFFYKWFTRFSIRISPLVAVYTKDYSRNSPILSGFEEKWRVVLPVFKFPVPRSKETMDFKIKYGLLNKQVIGYSGRLVKEKGVDFLFRAIPSVIKEVPNAHFVFAGPKIVSYEDFWQENKMLIERIEKHCRFLGLIEDEKELAEFYASCDVLVIPSRRDCFPSASIEAMFCGTPVVCADVPGARWAVKKTGMGFLVKPQDPKALAAGIVKVLRNRKKYVKPRKEIEKIFDYKKTLNEYERLFLSQGGYTKLKKFEIRN